MKYTVLSLVIATAAFFSACNPGKLVTSSHSGQTFPSWIRQSNIYEVNVRQYSAEGTFKAFQKSLPRLRAMGVDILWFMPIQPISKLDRKGVLGSYYAVADYKAVNPEFGSMQDWKELVNAAHTLGFKVIIDWVPNHSGADHRWLQSHPDFYVQDNSGKAVSPFDWTDTRKLNYQNPALRDSMTESMRFWITDTHIDGFRCDVAAEVPIEYWKPAIASLRNTKKDLFMLAEADQGWLHDAGFNETYGWEMFAKMKEVASGTRPAYALDSVLANQDKTFPKGAIKLYFTSNHDENSWNKSDYGTFPGAKHAPFAVFTQTMRYSLPLIYSGQEVPVLDSISFFYKNPIQWTGYNREAFYRTLLNLRKDNDALAVDASFTKLNTGADDKVYAFTRERDGDKVLVMLNFSDAPVTFNVQNTGISSKAKNVFSINSGAYSDGSKTLPAWGYEVWSDN